MIFSTYRTAIERLTVLVQSIILPLYVHLLVDSACLPALSVLYFWISRYFKYELSSSISLCKSIMKVHTKECVLNNHVANLPGEKNLTTIYSKQNAHTEIKFTARNDVYSLTILLRLALANAITRHPPQSDGSRAKIEHDGSPSRCVVSRIVATRRVTLRPPLICMVASRPIAVVLCSWDMAGFRESNNVKE